MPVLRVLQSERALLLMTLYGVLISRLQWCSSSDNKSGFLPVPGYSTRK